jgi:hypothetical protein
MYFCKSFSDFTKKVHLHHIQIIMNQSKQRILGIEMAQSAGVNLTQSTIKDSSKCFADILNTAATELPGGVDALVEHVLKGPSRWAYETLAALPNLNSSHREKLIKKADEHLKSLAEKHEANKILAKKSDFKESATNKYPATGSFVSAVIYYHFWVNLTDQNKQFNGNAGGVGVPGGGAMVGDVYTDDLDRLIKETKNFQFGTTPLYFELTFFTDGHDYLGTFQAGGIGIALGTGGGNGKWS